jgi:hypothetical protein
MISFSLTNEQKKAAMQTVVNNLESEIYHIILFMGSDPESFDFSQIESMATAEAPSNEHRLYNNYTRYNQLKAQIASL